MYQLWENLFIGSSVLFVISLGLLIWFRFLKNVYFHVYQPDELFKTENNELRNAKNYIYSTSDYTRKYIKKYALCKNGRDRYIVCNFTEPFHSITYYVIGYTSRRRVTEVLEIHDVNTTLSSKVICLNKNTKLVNIVVGSVDGTLINAHVIKPIPKNNIRLYSLLMSVCTVSGLFSVRHILLEIIAKFSSKFYYDSFYNHIGLIVLGILFVFIYIITYTSINKRNSKNRVGGSLEYEFF